jgi:hypothetical protein
MLRHPIRLLALLYTTLVVIVAAWTIHTAITMRASSTEHLLPAFTLMIVCFPASLSLPAIATAFPGHFDTELSQAAWVTFCGLFQAVCLLLVARSTGKRTTRPPG